MGFPDQRGLPGGGFLLKRIKLTGRTVRFPHDGLTEEQLAKLNGPVQTYRFVPDVSEEELKHWPKDLREEYYRRFGR